MRNIVNISLPAETVRQIKHEVKIGGYASVSEYFRHILRERHESQLLKELKRERSAGLIKMNSLRDLMD
jgi:Arc/MetJ-type ribon-helix-helix transcriptional regulator